MRYFAVGSPIEDLQSTFLSAKPRKIKQEELESSFYQQTTIFLFSSYDQAKGYAQGLRHMADDFTHYPKTALNRSKVRPVFTLDLAEEIQLGDPQKKLFVYQEHYVDDEKIERTREQGLKLNFYEINPNLINKNNIVRAEFFKSSVAPVEFVHNKRRKTCVIS